MRLRTLCFLSVAVVLVGEAVPAQAQLRKREMAREDGPFVCSNPSARAALLASSPFSRSAIAFMSPVRFTDVAGKHGFHVHQYGDLSDTAKGESVGGTGILNGGPTELRTPGNATWATWATSMPTRKRWPALIL